MKRYLITGSLILVIGLFLANYIFSAIPDKEWKKERMAFQTEYTKAKSPAERAIAIRKLTEIDHPGIVKVLVSTVLTRELKENELLNVDIVATALSKLGDPAAIDELVSVTKKTNPPDKIILIQALGKVSSEGAKGLLLELLKHKNKMVKAAAIDALAESLPAEALETILKLLDYKSWEVKVSVISYLARLTDDETKKKALEALKPRLNKETGRLRNDISEAINQLMAQSEPSDDNKSGATMTFFDIPLEGDVVFVIDVSSSMEGKNAEGVSRWDKLVEQLKQSLEVMAKAKPPVKFNIIAYGERIGEFENGLVPAARNKDKAIKWLDTIKPGSMMAPGKLGGFTNIYDAVEMALLGQSTTGGTKGGQKIIITSGVPNPYTICLMTDGKANRGKYTVADDILTALRILNQTRKIRINTIALDLGVSETGPMYTVDSALMEQIAAEHKGTCKKF